MLVSKINMEQLQLINDKLKNKKEYKFMLDRLEHSIIIIKKDQIEYVNDSFLSQFQNLINKYVNDENK